MVMDDEDIVYYEPSEEDEIQATDTWLHWLETVVIPARRAERAAAEARRSTKEST